jgi:hypothetical protein
MTHPREQALALLAGGEAGPIRRFLLERHVNSCADCREKIAAYRALRDDVAEIDLPELNWSFLAADMRANIRLGLEAGACVRSTQTPRRWNLRPVIAFACVLLLAGAGELLRDARPHRPVAADSATQVSTTDSGVELRTGGNSLTLLKHHGDAANQTVSARGDISESLIDSETGAVTIYNVSLQ